MLVEKNGRLVRKLWMKHRAQQILDSFESDSSHMPNTAAVRTKEVGDVFSIAKVTNIPKDMLMEHEERAAKLDSLFGVSARYRNRYHGVSENSFSKQRNIYDETARINLNNIEKRHW